MDAALTFADGAWDIRFNADGGLTADETFQTAVVMSLFTDRRVGDERGHWADSEGDRWGSRLWTLLREKITDRTVALVERYCREALQWLIDDKIAASVRVNAAREGLDRVNVEVLINRTDGGTEAYQFDDIWRRL